jgi:hypothetical protein
MPEILTMIQIKKLTPTPAVLCMVRVSSFKYYTVKPSQLCTYVCCPLYACMGKGRKVFWVLVGKPEGKKSLERPMRRWEFGVKMDLREIGWGSVEWIQLA